jgi:hypothetical protein
MLMATLMGALTLTARAMTQASESARQRRVEAGLERVLRHDLEGAVQPDAKNVASLIGGPAVPSEITEEPCLEFLTTSHLAPAAEAGGTGIKDVTYVLRTDSEAEGKLVLLRGEREYTPGKAPPDRPLERLATGLTFWELSFYDGSQWLSQWKRKAMPVAVRLQVSFEGEEQRQCTIEMTFAPMARADANPAATVAAGTPAATGTP